MKTKQSSPKKFLKGFFKPSTQKVFALQTNFSKKQIRVDGISCTIFLLVIALGIFGCLMVYSASSYVAKYRYDNEYFYLTKQIIGVVLGIIAMFIFSKIAAAFTRCFSANWSPSLSDKYSGASAFKNFLVIR